MREAIRNGTWLTAERIAAYSAMLGVASLAALAATWGLGSTPLTDIAGRPIGTDFSGFWTAGRMLLQGDTTGMFDPVKHFAFQSAVFANPDIDHYGWHYPPPFLAVAGLFAMFPYVTALLLWQGMTFALFYRTIAAIVPQSPLVLVATIGFPATFLTLGHGHNAFLTSALLGTGLLLLGRRPLLAGVCLGLLSYKPQFGIVIPFVVILGGHWRTAQAASVTIAAMIALSMSAFGAEAWLSFFKFAAFTKSVVLEQGGTGWYKIQSAFSAVRALHGSVAAAYAAQAVLTLTILLSLAAAILMGADRRLVAAATATASLLATPYCLDYDMTILGIAIAFMVAHSAQFGFAPYEKTFLAAVWILPLFARSVMQGASIPIGVVVMTGFYTFIMHRSLATAGVERPILRRLARG